MEETRRKYWFRIGAGLIPRFPLFRRDSSRVSKTLHGFQWIKDTRRKSGRIEKQLGQRRLNKGAADEENTGTRGKHGGKGG